MLSNFAAGTASMFKQAFAFAGGMALVSSIRGAVGRMTGLVQQGINYNAMIEGTVASFEVMTGSIDKAKAMLGELVDLAAKTPFQLPQLTGAATQLMATKEIAESELLPTIKKLGDAAAGSAEGFAALPRIVRAISQMLGKGKVTGEEMMQLAEAGIPAWSALAEEMGMSVAELQKMSQKGKLGRDVVLKLIDALGNRFKGMADKQSKTFTGLWSTIVDNFNMAIGKITKPIFDRLKPAMDVLVAMFDSDVFGSAVDRIAAGVEWIVSLIESGLKNPIVQAGLAFAGLVAAALTTGAAIAIIVPLVSGLAATIGQILIPVLAISAALVGVGILVRNAFTGPEGPAFLKTLGNIWELVKEIGTNLANVLLPVLRQIGSAMSSAFGGSGTLQDGFNSFLGTVLGGLEGLLDYISLFTTNFNLTWEFIKTAGVFAFNVIMDKLIALASMAPAAFDAVATAASLAVLMIDDAFRNLINLQLPNLFITLPRALGAQAEIAAKLVVTIIAKAFDYLAKIIPEAFSNIFTMLADQVSAFGRALFSLAVVKEKLAKGDIYGAGKAAMAAQGQLIIDIAKNAAKAWSPLVGGNIDFAKDIAGDVAAATAEAAAATVKAISDAPAYEVSPETRAMQEQLKAQLAILAAGPAGAATPETEAAYKKLGELLDQMKRERDIARILAMNPAAAAKIKEAEVAAEADAAAKPPPAEEAKKAKKAEFVGLADLNKRIQESLTSSEAKDRRALVKAAKEGAEAGKEAVKLHGKELEMDLKVIGAIEKFNAGFAP